MSDEILQQPGDVLRNMLEMKGWTQTILASVLGKPVPHINGIVKGKRTITPDVAVGLASAFGTDPDFWLTLENQRQLADLPAVDSAIQQRARCFEIAPVKDMQKRGWISESATADDLVRELREFLHQDDLSVTPSFRGNARRSAAKGELSPSQCAWCYRAWQLANSLPVKEFDHALLDQCEAELQKLKALRSEARNVSKCLSEFGIRFVVVEPLPGSVIDGAAFWLSDASPVIAVSLRFDRLDSFWFTLMHEFSHIRHRDALSVDLNLGDTDREFSIEKPPEERRADNEAAASLIKPSTLESFMKRVGPLYSKARIVQFAHRIKVHPGIIVGQLQHRGEIGFHAHKQFLVKVRDTVTETAVTDGWGQVISGTVLG